MPPSSLGAVDSCLECLSLLFQAEDTKKHMVTAFLGFIDREVKATGTEEKDSEDTAKQEFKVGTTKNIFLKQLLWPQVEF
jgi:hypothetical protein